MSENDQTELWAKWTAGESLTDAELAQLERWTRDQPCAEDIVVDAMLRSVFIESDAPKSEGISAELCAQAVMRQIESPPAPAVNLPPMLSHDQHEVPKILISQDRSELSSDRLSTGRSLVILATAAVVLLAIGMIISIAARNDREVEFAESNVSPDRFEIRNRTDAGTGEVDSAGRIRPRVGRDSSSNERLASDQLSPNRQPEILPSKPGGTPLETGLPKASLLENEEPVPASMLAVEGEPRTDVPPEALPEPLPDSKTQKDLPSPFARLVSSDTSRWKSDYAPGENLRNDRLQLKEGSATLLMASGAKVEIRGSSDLRVVGENRIQLTSGSLSAHVPSQAIGFTVETDAGNVVDLGTRFRVQHRSGNPYVFVAVDTGSVQTIRPPRVRGGQEITTSLAAGRTQWLPLSDRAPSLDWQMSVRFVDPIDNPRQVVIDDKEIDISTLSGFAEASELVLAGFEECRRQMDLVRHSDSKSVTRFSGKLSVTEDDRVIQTLPISNSRQLAAAEKQLTESMNRRSRASFMNESIFDQMPVEIKKFFQTGEIPIPGGFRP